MKRRLLIVAIFLLAGAVVNVAVAWGCRLAVRPSQGGQFQHIDASAIAWWNENKPHGVTDEPTFFMRTESFGWSAVRLVAGEGGELRLSDQVVLFSTKRITEASHVAAGLPMKSLHGHSWSVEGKITQSGVIATGSHDSLPYVPIWPGFAVNTLFYAAVLWLLIPGPFAFRRFIRVKRGRCPKCAYPMGQADVCSECGKPLPGRMAVMT